MREIKTEVHIFEVGEVVKINGEMVKVVKKPIGIDACYDCLFGNLMRCGFFDCEGITFKKIKTKSITPIDIPVGELFELKGMFYRVTDDRCECCFGPCSSCQAKHFLACSNAHRKDCKIVTFELME